jgi:molecular chaperone GrpE
MNDVDNPAGAAAGTDAAAEPPVDPAQLQQERDDYYDRLLRLTAEFDNYRKRVERDRREAGDRASAAIFEHLLPIVDDFERALAAEADPAAEPYRRGVELIYRQLLDLLGRYGVTPLEVIGVDFDPHLHEAVAYGPAPGRREGEIVEEVRRGYKMGDRLLRPAMVKVARA